MRWNRKTQLRSTKLRYCCEGTKQFNWTRLDSDFKASEIHSQIKSYLSHTSRQSLKSETDYDDSLHCNNFCCMQSDTQNLFWLLDRDNND